MPLLQNIKEMHQDYYKKSWYVSFTLMYMKIFTDHGNEIIYLDNMGVL